MIKMGCQLMYSSVEETGRGLFKGEVSGKRKML
jgi:hypothetical protein